MNEGMKLMVLTCVHGMTAYRGNICLLFLDRMKNIRETLGVEMLVVGSEGEDSRLPVERSGAHYIEHVNKPVSAKWNAGLQEIRKHNPTHVMILGSDDFVSDSLIQRYISLINTGWKGLIGITDSYYITLSERAAHFNRCIYWPGYPGQSSLGYARCIPSEMLDAVQWSLWPTNKNSGMDFASNVIMRKTGLNLPIKKFSVKEEGWLHIDIKSRGNISSISPLIKKSDDADFDEIINSHLPVATANDILSYRDSMVELYNNKRK